MRNIPIAGNKVAKILTAAKFVSYVFCWFTHTQRLQFA